MKKSLDLSTYKWPEAGDADTAFPAYGTPPELVQEASRRNPAKGMEKFRELFFRGGRFRLKKGVKGTWKEKAFLYARAMMGSREPKHEHKELVCGMIFEECLKL